MKFMRRLDLASALGLILAAIPAFVSAQSARDGETRSALLTLQRELAEPLIDVTPALLNLQEELVEALRLEADGTREDARRGMRPLIDIVAAEQTYYSELETLQVMKARLKNKSISRRELLKIRIAVISDLLATLQEALRRTRDRYAIGEVTKTEIVKIQAAIVKTRVMTEALMQAAGK